MPMATNLLVSLYRIRQEIQANEADTSRLRAGREGKAPNKGERPAQRQARL